MESKAVREEVQSSGVEKVEVKATELQVFCGRREACTVLRRSLQKRSGRRALVRARGS
jgi:hypothetical protein